MYSKINHKLLRKKSITNFYVENLLAREKWIKWWEERTSSVTTMRASTKKSTVENSHSLCLCDMLFILKFTEKLLSVSRFTQDNMCLFEFLPNTCFAKDLHTKKLLLRGRLSNGLDALIRHPLSSLQSKTNLATSSHSICADLSRCTT